MVQNINVKRQGIARSFESVNNDFPRSFGMCADNLFAKLKHNYQSHLDSGSEKLPAVLLSTGSFNPVHRMHIGAFELSKLVLESIYTVLFICT